MQAGLASFNQKNSNHASLPSKRKTKKEKARISSDQLLEMIAEAETKFIKPKPQPDLDGELGVTLSDIAESLGVAHSDLRRKLERSGEMEFLTILNHKVKTIVFFTADNRAVDSYVLDMMAAQHIVAKYDNLSGRYYLDFLIRCKDALKVSLEQHQKLETELDRISSELSESNKKLEAFLQPKLTRRNNLIRRSLVKEPDGLFHEGKYSVVKETIKQPRQGDENYDEHKMQKISRITAGNIETMLKICRENKCDSGVLNFVMGVLEEYSKYADTLINPENPEVFTNVKKELERAMTS